MTPPRADPVFPKRLTIWVSAVAGACLVASIVLAIVTEDLPSTRTGSDSTNPSAIGHTALVDLLRATGCPVVVSRNSTARRSAGASLLLLLEPLAGGEDKTADDLSELIDDAACPVLVVLPKWRGIPDPDRPGRLGRVERRPAPDVESVLRAVHRSAKLVPLSGGGGWTVNHLGPVPDLGAAPQLVDAGGWEPFLAGPAGFLAAVRDEEERSVTILSDPDLLANHGLHRGDNARIVLDLVGRLRADDRPVLVDETLHGLGAPESFWAQMFRFPFVLATLQAAFAAALLLWCGMRRFGAPEPAPPPFDPGKRFLIDHVAGLLDSERHHGEAVARFAALAAEDAARRLHAPAAGREEVRAWLARREARRKVTETLGSLEAEAAGLRRSRPRDARAALAIARRLNRWKQEMLDGPRLRTGAR